MMNCKQATQLLSEKQDRDLSLKEQMSLGVHISMCPACRKFGHQMKEIRFISKCYLKNPTSDDNE
ncbi:zf-HC2 domain-containing protein [Vibrio salinus]|uniref:zf-HC2 domain-containing protein n=1 Tax=Vibrio salinus TaxID=2899784 RepID=UPI001E44FDF1|nr:zf-HC2 domain-containing protein [Vibrio salinus]MCE0493384.1 zf-HC2 domain-containing protein [Vibrio salinus]